MSWVNFISVGSEFHIWEPFIEKADYPKEVLQLVILQLALAVSLVILSILPAEKIAQNIWCQIL